MSVYTMIFLFFAVSSVAVKQVLTESNIAKLMDLLHNFSDKWNEIGLVLGFTQPELNQIKTDPSLYMSGAPASFLAKLLSQWVQWPTVDHPRKPTLVALCKTLRSSLVGLGSLAEEVEREMKCSKPGTGLYHIVNYKAYTLIKPQCMCKGYSSCFVCLCVCVCVCVTVTALAATHLVYMSKLR